MLFKNAKVKMLLIGLILALALTGCTQTNNEEVKQEPVQKLKIGMLPTEDSLPLIVAKQNGYYEEQNLDVELITFQSAVESQSAIQSGQIDGMITDMIVAALLKDSGLDIKITTITYGATPDRRRFAIVASPNSGIEKAEDLKGKSIGISNNSIIEYTTDKFLEEAGVNPQDVEKTAIPKIPVRLEMLLNNQIAAANIPEPLITFAELQGAKVIADDTTNVALSQAVLIMSNQAIENGLEGFYKAYAKAVEEINADPSQYKDIFVKNINIPEPIIEKYQVPTYPTLQLPAEKDINDVLDWLNEKGLLPNSTKSQDLTQTGLY